MNDSSPVYINVEPAYRRLYDTLAAAFLQAQEGKGKDRHASGDAFCDQPIMSIQKHLGKGFALGQAVKKVWESERLEQDHAITELRGAIVYIAAAIMHIENGKAQTALDLGEEAT